MPSLQRPAQLRKSVEMVLGDLTDEERAILAGRLRFDDTRAESQHAVASRLGCSQPHVSNCERDLIEKLNRIGSRRAKERLQEGRVQHAFDDVSRAMEALGQEIPVRALEIRW